jgi:hypothetical protein
LAKKTRAKAALTWQEAADTIEEALAGTTRADILDHALSSGGVAEAFRALRTGMRTHRFAAGDERLLLEGIVRRLDARTIEDGFHVLQEWDGEKFLEETIPVLLLDYYVRANKAVRPDRGSLSILLDYYFLYVLALLVLRAWDEGDPNENLDRVTDLLGHLQGPGGSGFKLVDDAATLLWVAISHYEPDDHAYHRLLGRARTLDPAHRARIARVGGRVLGDHLRWGFPVYYEQDLGLMRADNVSDYPWLLWSTLTLMQEYGRMREEGVEGAAREDVVEALLNALTPDPPALLDRAPASLAAFQSDHTEWQALFARYGAGLLEEFQRHRPAPPSYSPLAFQFNFPHNVLIPMVTLALIQGRDPQLDLSLNALLTREREENAPGSPSVLARTLMAYAGYSPERRGGRRTLMITYDPNAALLSFSRAMTQMSEALGRIGAVNR